MELFTQLPIIYNTEQKNYYIFEEDTVIGIIPLVNVAEELEYYLKDYEMVLDDYYHPFINFTNTEINYQNGTMTIINKSPSQGISTPLTYTFFLIIGYQFSQTLIFFEPLFIKSSNLYPRDQDYLQGDSFTFC